MIDHKLIYNFNDMSFMFYTQTKGNYSYLDMSKIDQLSLITTLSFLKNFGFVLGSNLLTLLFLVINFIFSYKLFFYIIKEKNLSLIFSLIFSFSIYFIYRVQGFTPNLYPIFIFPLVILMLYRNSRPIYVGLLLGFFSIFSSYYMFFAGVVAVLWYLFFRKFKDLLIYFLSFISFVTILNFQIILNNIPFFEKLEVGIQNENAPKVIRPIEDWYNFSIKPWYFVIPPKNSLFFSDLSNYIHNKISNTGYFLTKNYVEDEMAGVFLGWHFVLGLLFVGFYFLYKPIQQKLSNHFENLNKFKNLILFSFFGIFSISIISLPPSFTVSGFEIFTPSYVLFQIVPFFRALSRWGIVIFLLTLIINFILFYDLSRLFKKTIHKATFLTLFIILNFSMFSVKLNVIDTKTLPNEIKELSQISTKSYVSLPTDYYSIFWGSLIKPDMQSISKELTSDLRILNSYSYTIFAKDSEIFSEIDSIVVYENKINQKEIDNISKINPEIQNITDIYNYLEKNFGNKVYFDERVVIFKKY